MNYQNIYNKLIEKAKIQRLSEDIYTESHHIIPESMGGLDIDENRVSLTAKQHFIAHHLLYKIYRNREMTNAFFLMCNVKRGNKKFRITSKQYQILKEEKIRIQKEIMTGQPSRAKGKKWSDESKAKLSATNTGHTRGNGGAHFKGKHHSEKSKKLLSEKQKGNKNHLGILHSEETKAMMRVNRKGKTKIPWTEERKAARRELLAKKKEEQKTPK